MQSHMMQPPEAHHDTDTHGASCCLQLASRGSREGRSEESNLLFSPHLVLSRERIEPGAVHAQHFRKLGVRKMHFQLRQVDACRELSPFVTPNKYSARGAAHSESVHEHNQLTAVEGVQRVCFWVCALRVGGYRGGWARTDNRRLQPPEKV